MANPNPSPTTRFKKGNRGGGRPKDLIRTDDVKRIVGKLWRAKRDEIKALLADADAPMGEMMIAAVMTKIVKDGDANRLNTLLDRAIGRVVPAEEEKVFEPFIIHRSDGTQIVLGTKTKESV